MSSEVLRPLIQKASRIVVFTGAGMSTESGISDYRSRGGLWDRFQPVTIQEFIASEDKRREYWAYKFDFMKQILQAKPNAGHEALARLEKSGRLKGVITQNIDGLHHLAGNSPEKILELHGTNRETICLNCGNIRPWLEVHWRLERKEEIPLCLECGGLIKPNTVSFGQALDPEVLFRAYDWIKDCDLFLAIGSTLLVEPAASLPLRAKQHGAKLVILTLSETPLDRFADLRLFEKAAEALKTAV